MSYAIIKNIKVNDDKVIVSYSDNNVSPKDYTPVELPVLSKVLQEKGKKELELEVMRAYESGNFQRGNNKYTRALSILLHNPEYRKISWRYNWEESRKEKNKEKLDKLLLEALDSKLPKEKYIITKKVGDEKVYFYHRANSHYCKWYHEKEKAKKFRWKEDTETTKKFFTNSSDWKVETI